jgi:hypothetical protein
MIPGNFDIGAQCQQPLAFGLAERWCWHAARAASSSSGRETAPRRSFQRRSSSTATSRCRDRLRHTDGVHAPASKLALLQSKRELPSLGVTFLGLLIDSAKGRLDAQGFEQLQDLGAHGLIDAQRPEGDATAGRP